MQKYSTGLPVRPYLCWVCRKQTLRRVHVSLKQSPMSLVCPHLLRRLREKLFLHRFFCPTCAIACVGLCIRVRGKGSTRDAATRKRASSIFQLVYLDLTQCDDFLAVLDLLNYIRQGVFFDSLHIIPPAATWSRSRHCAQHLYVHGKLLSVSRRSTRQNTKKFIKQTPFSRVSLGVLSKRSAALLKLLD